MKEDNIDINKENVSNESNEHSQEKISRINSSIKGGKRAKPNSKEKLNKKEKKKKLSKEEKKARRYYIDKKGKKRIKIKIQILFQRKKNFQKD